MGQSTLWTVVITFAMASSVNSWDPDAGLVTSYTKMAGVSANPSSNPDEGLKVVDGNDSTHWTSAGCLPYVYLSNPFLNVLHDACGQGRCTSSSTSDENQLRHATDGSFYRNLMVRAVNGNATFTLQFPQPQQLKYISVRGRFDADTQLRLLTSGGLDLLVRTLTSQDNYKVVTSYTLNLTSDVTTLTLTSQSAFMLSELGGLGPRGCVDRMAVDLGRARQVGVIRTRHWAGNAGLTSRLLTSEDGVTWNEVSSLEPGALGAVMTYLDTPTSARYLAVEHVIKEDNYAKSYVWEIDAWDSHGPWGSAPPPQPNPESLRSILGVNGIWGWGLERYSDGAGPGEGPHLYAPVASEGRNYHNLGWDVRDPDTTPNYTAMALGGGTDGQWWLNWDQEYAAWRGAGMTVDASIQFLAKTQPPSVWNDPRGSAARYGRAFARHFGPTQGTGNVRSMEVGNEPWDYAADFYAQILEGMAAGAKEGDPAMLVLPGAFQAHDRFAEAAPHANYIGTRLTPNASASVDAVNGHYYSYLRTQDGVRRATFPENPASSFNGVRNLLRWRDANMAGKPVWVTEWGWDSDGAGESCGFSECVGEDTAAVYGLRGLMVLARLGIERAHWYFYANGKNCNHLYCRSGLTGSRDTGFAKKKAFLAFQDLLARMGDKHFLSAAKEDSTAYIYLFGDYAGGSVGGDAHSAVGPAHSSASHASSASSSAHPGVTKVTHVVAWRPVSTNDNATASVTFSLNAAATRGWRFSPVSVPLVTEEMPRVSQGVWQIDITSNPLLIEL